MDAIGFALFDTTIGACGIAWSAIGVRMVQFPEAAPEATRARLARRSGAPESEPPAEARRAIAGMQALLEGGSDDLNDIALDFEGAEPFQRRVWEMIREIPPGETRTYGDLARALGNVSLSRAVGHALGQNPCPIIAPCHRVLGADGRTGGFSGGSGVETKMRLLTIEKARIGAEPSLFANLPLAARPRRSRS